jgi:hypothetical protein
MLLGRTSWCWEYEAEELLYFMVVRKQRVRKEGVKN